MKACILTDWEKLEIRELPMPVPGEGQVLVELLYGGVCGSDVTVSRHKHLTATVPRILCHEMLGRVKEIHSAKPQPSELPGALESGTLPTPGIAGLDAALK